MPDLFFWAGLCIAARNTHYPLLCLNGYSYLSCIRYDLFAISVIASCIFNTADIPIFINIYEYRMDWIIVIGASLFAGFVDAIVGGGGLILVPALFATFPHMAPATLLGTNKSASVWGTTFATIAFSRRIHMPWRVMLPAALAGFIGSFIGAWLVTLINPDILRKLLPFILLAILVYTFVKKDLGQAHQPRWQGQTEIVIAAAIGLMLGVYDGFFGPGTGSFLVFLLVRVLGYDFLHASAGSKLINVSTNMAAIALFASKGHVWWKLGLAMAVANMAGSLLGSRLALRHGAGFIRWVFMLVVMLLILKTGYDAFLSGHA